MAFFNTTYTRANDRPSYRIKVSLTVVSAIRGCLANKKQTGKSFFFENYDEHFAIPSNAT